MQRSALCRSRRELSNAYLLAKFGSDTAENEPSEVCPIKWSQKVLKQSLSSAVRLRGEVEHAEPAVPVVVEATTATAGTAGTAEPPQDVYAF